MSGTSFDIFGGGDSKTTTSGIPGGIGRGAAEPTAADKLVNAEQQRTERSRLEAIQNQLRLETASSSRGYGLRSLFGALGSARSSLLGSG
jgi:hypothetical protein